MKALRFSRVLMLAAVVVLTACSSAPPLVKAEGVNRLSVERSTVEGELSAFRASALTLGTALLADGGDGTNGNVVASPGSLLIALAMLRAGATGESAAEMDAVLGLPASNRDGAMNAVLASLEKFDGDPGSVDEANPPSKPLLRVANGLFVDKSVPTGEDYLETLARHYGTGVYPVDFTDEATTRPAIDAWVDENTGGRIKKAPAEYSEDNTFSLLNAVYFASAWKEPFSANGTREDSFTLVDGAEVSVPMMQGLRHIPYAEGDGWQAVDLPYGDGFAMRLLLPGEGVDKNSFDVARLAEVAAGLEVAGSEHIQLALPTWDHKSSFDVRKVLAGLGLATTLDTKRDFDAIQPRMKIAQAAQAANITVAEKGTVAAAVTQINAGPTSGQVIVDARTLEFNRPFQYQIVHLDTGMPLFMGKVADPR